MTKTASTTKPQLAAGTCAPCAAGAHTTHSASLGGLCVGCPCPVRNLPIGGRALVIAPPEATATDPWPIGHVRTITVSITGPVEAVGDGYIVIGGHTIPTRLSETVRHASTEPPGLGCDGGCAEWANDDETAELIRLTWVNAARKEHDEHKHPGAFPTCPDGGCRTAREA